MKIKKLCSLLLVILLGAALIAGCDSQMLDQAAQILLQELLSQQQQQQQNEQPLPPSQSPVLFEAEETAQPSPASGIKYGDAYYTEKDVADYLHAYNELPPNYITKSQAKNKGWKASEGNLWDVAEGACIGGDYFGNYEAKLPEAKNRDWYECDVNYSGGYRGAERLLYSNDGLIYYSDDHYASFTQLY